MPRARTKRLPALLVPTWVVVPFAASTAAAGLYLVWVHRGQKKKRAGEDEEPVIDLKPSAQAQYLIQNPDKAAAEIFYDRNFSKMEAYWKAQASIIFAEPHLSLWNIPPEQRLSTIKIKEGLDDFKEWLPKDEFKSRNLEDAKKEIRERLRALRINFQNTHKQAP